MQWVIAGLMCLLLTVMVGETFGQNLPSASEIVDGYLVNRSKLGGGRIVWRYEQAYPPGFFEAAERNIAELERVLQAGTLTARDESGVRAQLVGMRRSLERKKSDSCVFDVWFQGKNAQVRQFANYDEFRSDFPDSPVGSKSLASEYAGIQIISFSNKSRPKLFWWEGKPTDAAMARVTRSNRRFVDSVFPSVLPPLVSANKLWGEEAFHHIDRFFLDLDSETARVEGGEIDGNTCAIVRGFRRSAAAGDQAELVEQIDAWIDADRGFLPLKIEWKGRYQKSGQPLEEVSGPVSRRLKVKKIDQLASGAFYPISGKHTLYTFDPDGPSPPSVEEQLSGASSDARPMEYQHDSWFVEKVESSLDLPDSFFELNEFPPNTMVYDVVSQKGEIVGLEGKDLRHAIETVQENHVPAENGFSRNIFFGVIACLIAVLVLIGFVALKKRRRE